MGEVHELLSPECGAMIGRYKLLRKVGEGGMGVVYEAEHFELGKRVALKVLRADLTGNAEVVGRFVREGQAAARIRHPHVVDVTDVGTARGVPYMVMEMLDGETLAALIERGPIGLDEVAALLLPVCAAVATAHAHGVLHRDLKPDNILLERTARGSVHPKVLDFGIAKVLDEDPSLSLTNTSSLLGTPYYMSPEQARGARDLDARSDQYALGVILYECSTGQRPFVADSLLALVAEITVGALRPPRALCPALPEDFEAVVLRAMARDPAQRFASVWQLGAALLPFANERARLLWEDAFHPSEGRPSVPERRSPTAPVRAPPVLVDTVGGPRPVVGDRVSMSVPPPPRRAPPWWAVALAGAALLGVAAYRFGSMSASTSTPSPVARVVAPPAEAPGATPVLVAADVVTVADVPSPAVVFATPPRLTSPVRAPVRPAPVVRRLPSGAPGQREIPME